MNLPPHRARNNNQQTMGQQTFNNRGHDGLFHPSAIPRFTLPVSADHVVFPTLYPGGSRRTGSGKPFPLVDLAVDFIAGDLSDGDRRSAWRSRRRSSFCSNHQRFLSLPPGFCEGNRIAGGAFRSLGSRSRIAQIQPGQLAPGDAGCLDRFNHGHRRSHGRARFTHTHHPTQSGRNDSRHRRNHAFCQ